MKKYQIQDFLGSTFANFTVIDQAPDSSNFLFRCKCGKIISEEPNRIISGHKKSCGFCGFSTHPNYSSADVRNELLSKRFSLLTIVGFKRSSNRWVAICQCDCGNTRLALPHELKSGKVKSCGCLRQRAAFHARNVLSETFNYHSDGRSKHPLYGTWNCMISRCENPNAAAYKHYGGRGISVCKEWHDFWEFVKWSDSCGGRPQGYTLDRINNNGNYEPSNCRWADKSTQSNNTRRCIRLSHNGETKTLSEWAVELGLSDQTMYNRYHRGWSEEDMFLPKQTGNNGFAGR